MAAWAFVMEMRCWRETRNSVWPNKHELLSFLFFSLLIRPSFSVPTYLPFFFLFFFIYIFPSLCLPLHAFYLPSLYLNSLINIFFKGTLTVYVTKEKNESWIVACHVNKTQAGPISYACVWVCECASVWVCNTRQHALSPTDAIIQTTKLTLQST